LCLIVLPKVQKDWPHLSCSPSWNIFFTWLLGAITLLICLLYHWLLLLNILCCFLTFKKFDFSLRLSPWATFLLPPHSLVNPSKPMTLNIIYTMVHIVASTSPLIIQLLSSHIW
jgi:hypothetical protein